MAFVGCACLVVDAEGRYLLVKETKAIARDRMALPGGKLEIDESLEQAAIRETFEESGLRVEVQKLLGVFHNPRTSEETFGVNFVYSAVVASGEITTSDEHPVIEWHTRDQVESLHAAGMLRGGHAIEAIKRHEAGIAIDPAIVAEIAASPCPS